MTKKHFIQLADTLRNTKPDSDHSARMEQWKRDVEALAQFCASQNSRFNHSRWYGYLNGECGPYGGAVK